MKKIFLFILFISGVIFSSKAAPCYGTRMPSRKQFFAGAQSYTIFQRKLEGDFGNLRSQQGFFTLSGGLSDWLSIDLKIGTGNILQHPVGRNEIDYPTSFAGGYGYRLKLLDKETTKAVFGFQHISVHPYSREIGDVRNEAILDDWQYSLLVSQQVKTITPYIGAYWSRVDYIHHWDNEHKRKMSSLAHAVGLVCGVDFDVTKKSWLNLEGQFFAGSAFSASYNYSF